MHAFKNWSVLVTNEEFSSFWQVLYFQIIPVFSGFKGSPDILKLKIVIYL